jgi:hypothetical protein
VAVVAFRKASDACSTVRAASSGDGGALMEMAALAMGPRQ